MPDYPKYLVVKGAIIQHCNNFTELFELVKTSKVPVTIYERPGTNPGVTPLFWRYLCDAEFDKEFRECRGLQSEVL